MTATERALPMIQVATGLPVVLTFQPDGTLHVEVDLSEALDLRSSSVYVDGEEAEDLTDAERERCTAVVQRVGQYLDITA